MVSWRLMSKSLDCLSFLRARKSPLSFTSIPSARLAPSTHFIRVGQRKRPAAKKQAAGNVGASTHVEDKLKLLRKLMQSNKRLRVDQTSLTAMPPPPAAIATLPPSLPRSLPSPSRRACGCVCVCVCGESVEPFLFVSA